jgi:hypothetical protein
VIDFLKIDVEGLEGKVIEAGDWRSYRPTIVVVEAIDPRGALTWEAWEPMLLAHGYTFLEFDGLNRWYRDLS